MLRWLVFLLIFLIGCGGGGESGITPEVNQDKVYTKDYSSINWNETSVEYQTWQTKLPKQVKDFPDFFNREIDQWIFDGWDKYPFSIGEMFPPNTVYKNKLFNCHYITILIMGNYDGEYIFLDYWDSDDDHAFFKGYDDQGELYITTWVVDDKWQLKLFRDISEITRKESQKWILP